jgi:hypothetical protein
MSVSNTTKRVKEIRRKSQGMTYLHRCGGLVFPSSLTFVAAIVIIV